VISIPNTKTQTGESTQLLSSAIKRPSARKKLVCSLLITSLIGMAWISLFPSDLKEKERLFSSFDDETSGEMIVFVSNRDGNEEIYTMNTDGTKLRRLTDNPASDRFPSWSPDGKKIVFISYRDGNANLYLMNQDGSNIERLTNTSAKKSSPSWAPDGKTIYFDSNADGGSNIYCININNKQIKGLHSWRVMHGTRTALPMDNGLYSILSKRENETVMLWILKAKILDKLPI